jgi:hypothetical protein
LFLFSICLSVKVLFAVAAMTRYRHVVWNCIGIAKRRAAFAGFLIDEQRSQAYGQVPVLALKKTPLRLQDGAEMQRRRRVFHSIRDHLQSLPETAYRFCLVAT